MEEVLLQRPQLEAGKRVTVAFPETWMPNGGPLEPRTGSRCCLSMVAAVANGALPSVPS